MEDEHLRRKQIMEEQKKAALEELAAREQMRAREREEKEREKDEYNKKVMIRSQIETQKDSVYKQYYNHFMENQDKLQNIYKNKAAVSDRDREIQRNDFERKEIESFQQRVNKEQEERAIRMTEERDMLRSFLQNQIE
jgi:deoxyribodipyrimidine photolyase